MRGDKVPVLIGIIGLILVAVILGAMANERNKHHLPKGTVTEKLWEQAYWQDGEQITPARYCLEIDDLTEICISQAEFDKYKPGDQYP